MPFGTEKATLMGSGAGAVNYWGDGNLGDCTFGASAITQTGDTIAIDTVLSTGSEAGGPGSSSYGNVVPNSSACYETTVLNTSGSYDGDMWVGQFTGLTIDASVTLTTDRPCRGMFIYVDGDCTINGSLSMSSRGGHANPTTQGGSDNNTVAAGGLQLGMQTESGSSSFTNDGTGFNGAGTAVRTAVANQDDIASNGSILTMSKLGAAGGPSTGGQGNTGKAGSQGSQGTTGGITLTTGGGGAGATTHMGCPNNAGANTAAGGLGGAFSGGAGGGGGASVSVCPFTPTGTGGQYGGAGGNGTRGGNHPDFYPAGGAGNAGGSGQGYGQAGQSGIGGIIWLLVKGDLTIGGSATIEAKGSAGGNANSPPNSAGGAGAGAGGGSIMVAYAGAVSNSGSISAGGGNYGTGRQGPQNPLRPGSGGDGGVHTIAVKE